MTLLVMGASGFLGAALVSHFQALDEEVVQLSFRPSDRTGFLSQLKSTIKKHRPRGIINAGASQNAEDSPAALEDLIFSNVFLPAVLAKYICDNSLDACLINFGTSWQIGEDGVSAPFNAYAASKSAAEPFLDHFALDGLRVATLRLYDTYGPNDARNKVVNLIVDAMIGKHQLPMSSGEQVIDLIHIDDAVAAVETVLNLLWKEQTGVHKVYAVRSGETVTLRDIVTLLKKAAGIEDADFIKFGVYPYRSRERFELYAGTHDVPGWSPRISLETGLAQMLDVRRKALEESA